MPKVVDLGHHLFERFFAVMREIDFGTELRRRAIAPMVLFVADPDERAQQGYAMLQGPLSGPGRWCRCSTNTCRRSRAAATTSRRRGSAASRSTFPALTPVVRSVVDRKNFSFLAYVLKTQDTTSELYQWMARVFVAFRELEVRLLLGEAAPQLRHSA